VKNTRVLAIFAQRIASHVDMERAVLGAVQATLPGVIEDVLRGMHFGGDTVRLYVPKTGTDARQQRDRRIGAAIASGDAVDVITRRENVSRRHVFRIKRQIKIVGEA